MTYSNVKNIRIKLKVSCGVVWWLEEGWWMRQLR